MKKKLAMLLAATMLATLFTGCGAGGKEDKGELNLYTWDGMFPQEILDGFEKVKPVIVNSVYETVYGVGQLYSS